MAQPERRPGRTVNSTGHSVGDRVRCTHQGNTIIGTVVQLYRNALDVELDGVSAQVRVRPEDGWAVEILPPPPPDEPVIGTLVQAGDQLFRRDRSGWQELVPDSDRRSWQDVIGCGQIVILHAQG